MSTTNVQVYPAPADYPERSRGIPHWVRWLVAGLVALGGLSVGAWTYRLPYFAFAPGPVAEVEELVSIEGEVVDPESELYMLTVAIGNEPVNIYEWVSAQLDPRVDLVEQNAVRPPSVPYEEYRQRNENLMDESVNLATYVALRYLGYEATFTGEGMLVVDTVADTPAHEVLQAGDVIVAIDGEAVSVASDGAALIQSHRPGETIILTVLRGEETLDLPVTLIEHTDDPGAPMVGFLPDTVNLHYEFPIDVEIDTSVAIGPSAGLVYTLAVINALTPEDELHGLFVAGTGTIDADGRVGAIGGVRQKVLAAEAAGAQVVFVPVLNYEEALRAGASIEIVPVETFQDALAYAAAHSGA